MTDPIPIIVAGEQVTTPDVVPVRDPYTGGVVHEVCQADAAWVERAIAAADEARGAMSALPAHVRREVLLGCLRRIEQQAEALAQLCRAEAGKPITAARGEVARMMDTFRDAAEVAGGLASGEVLDLGVTASGAGYRGMVKRVPVGPCSLITPFNFPLNLVAHKVAPAIAAGCPFVVKPADTTPGCALALGRIVLESFVECNAPVAAVSVLPMPLEWVAPLVEDERFKLLSFTGSAKVGWDLKARAGKKKVVLELGGNAACVVDEGADLERALPKIVAGAFGFAGQSCISVQRLLVHASLIDAFLERFLRDVEAVVVGDPAAEYTVAGPVIKDDAAQRIRVWINEAVDAGAEVLAGENCTPDRNDPTNTRLLRPTVLRHVPHDAKLWTDEVFGPVVALETYEDFEDAMRLVNDSAWGLQAGVFTPSLDRALRAWDALEVGGVLINEAPTWRADPMPYGGVKASGFGREGARYAVDDMTEPRLCVIAPS